MQQSARSIQYLSVEISTSQYLQIAMYLYFWHASSDSLIVFESSVARWISSRQFFSAALNGAAGLACQASSIDIRTP